MKNPNGYGSVVKLKGARRRPYMVKKTAGWNEKGHPVYRIIGYYPTREAGMLALAQFNQAPYSLEHGKITVAELFGRLKEAKFPKLGEPCQAALKSAFMYCKTVSGMKYKELRACHMQSCIDNCGHGYATQAAIKNLFYHLDRYAREIDLSAASYSDLLTCASVTESTKRPFTDDEVAALWRIKDEPWVDSVLIFLYSGWRISELLNMKLADIDLEAGTMRGGVKSLAGKNRIVPIHSKIHELVSRRVRSGRSYLFESSGGKSMSSTTYYGIWWGVMNRIGVRHTVHETRHTFRSRLDSAGANKTAIDRLMGHTSAGTGEKIYTHKTLSELKETIELILN